MLRESRVHVREDLQGNKGILRVVNNCIKYCTIVKERHERSIERRWHKKFPEENSNISR